ncbi:MAG: hypothetical protein V1809_12020 [Planctomycetota bacterium]
MISKRAIGYWILGISIPGPMILAFLVLLPLSMGEGDIPITYPPVIIFPWAATYGLFVGDLFAYTPGWGHALESILVALVWLQGLVYGLILRESYLVGQVKKVVSLLAILHCSMAVIALVLHWGFGLEWVKG